MNELNVTDLIKAGRTLVVPFELKLQRENEGPAAIRISEILRLLPGRRIVAKAEVKARQYLVKIFVGPGCRRYANREARGVLAIEDAGVSTPFFEWRARLQGGGGEVLAFEYIEDATSLADDWRESDLQMRAQLMRRVIPDLARLHESGVLQDDIHPENFLVKKDRMLTIDGGQVVQRRNLGYRQSLNNLAMFFAQFQNQIDNSLPQLLKLYENARGWTANTKRLDKLRSYIGKHNTRRKKAYIEKAFRDCTRFSCSRGLRQFVVCEREFDTPVMQKIIKNPDQAISQGRLLKMGGSATVAVMPSDAGPIVIKRYNNKGTAHRLTRMFRRSRASVSWANTFRLEFLGINTLKPVALIEERFGPLRGRAYFITRYLGGDDASALMERPQRDAEVTSIVGIINDLKAAGVSHGDLKSTNFLLTDNGAAIIDLDSMREHATSQGLRKAQIRDQERFLRNWRTDPALEKKFADLLKSP